MTLQFKPLAMYQMYSGGSYVINDQFLVAHKVNRHSEYVQRLNCILSCTRISGSYYDQATEKVMTLIELECLSRKRCLEEGHSKLDLKSYDLGHTYSGIEGSLLLQLHRTFCHCCNRYSFTCVKDLNDHFICRRCYKRGEYGSYPYGLGRDSCCTNNGCGDKMIMDTNYGMRDVISKACSLYSKYEKLKRS